MDSPMPNQDKLPDFDMDLGNDMNIEPVTPRKIVDRRKKIQERQRVSS